MTQEPPARATASQQVQRIEAGQPTQPEQPQRFGKNRRRNLGLLAMIRQGLQFQPQAEDLLPVGKCAG